MQNTSKGIKADAYVLLSNHGTDDNTIGIAFFKSICSEDKEYRASIVEYYVDEMVTAQVK